MRSENKAIGDLGEKIAERYLIENGYKIIDKNFRYKTGEIDLIGKDYEYITFIEVKTRTSSYFGFPREAVTLLKQQKIYRTAEIYILQKKLFKFNFRFDVVEVFLSEMKKDYSVTLIKNAFQV
ncbi:MAG: YraN family protein [Clostridiaceae bacterium]|nr:YraN family protein [Clostridiaceae bacterium]